MSAVSSASADVRLPRVAGRAPRIVLLVFRDADTDSRVLKSAASLRAAGAEVLIIGLAPYRSGLPAGDAATPDGLRLHRTSDLDLVRTFRPAVRVWRRLRGRDPVTGSIHLRGVPRHTGSAAAVPHSTAATRQSRPVRASAVRQRATDVYMRGYRVVRLTQYWVAAIAAARRFEPDVVHANDGNTLAPAIVLRAVCGSRIVYDSHELWLHRNVRPDRWIAPLVEAATERLGVRLADAVITVSPSIAGWLQCHYGLAEPPYLVRNIPVWSGQIPDPLQGRLRALTGLTPQDRVISYCGGITSGRGLEETVDALVLLPADVHLVMLGFGSSPYLLELRARADRLGVGDRVHVAGPVPGPEVPIALADAELAIVYVRPIVLSYRYSLPNKLFESIHAGLPIIAADLPDCAALVREHGVGEVFTAGTPTELAAAIGRTLAHPEQYRAAARRLAPQLDWRAEARRLVEAHSRAVRRCRP